MVGGHGNGIVTIFAAQQSHRKHKITEIRRMPIKKTEFITNRRG